MPPNAPPLNGRWDLPEVADAQYSLVTHELALDPEKVPPYAAFLRAMQHINPPFGASLLDVGCGVGHYGTLLRRSPWSVRYLGVDVSQAMIDVARQREPGLDFQQGDMRSAPYGNYSIVLHALAAECGPQTLANLAVMLRETVGTVIWHRVRLTPGETGYVTEATYAGHSGRIWLWNLTDLIGFLNLSVGASQDRGYVIQSWPERDDLLTVILEA